MVYFVNLFWFLFGLFLGGLSVHHRNHKRKEVILLALKLVDNNSVPITIVGAVDSEGSITEIPIDTTFEWEAVKTAGDGEFGIFTQDEDDPKSGIFNAGAAGTSGVIQVTATLPSGKTIDGKTDTIDIIPGEAVSFQLAIGDPIVVE